MRCAAEADVRAAFGQSDAANRVAVRREYHHTVESRSSAPTGPQVTVRVATETVWRAVFARIDEYAPVHEAPAVLDIVHTDAPRLRARFDNVEAAFVGREADAVRIDDVVGDHLRPAVGRVEAVDVGRQFGLSFDTLIVVRDAERWISEPDAVVALHDHVH